MSERPLERDIDQMLAEVSATEGLDDFGHPSFRDGLEQLVSSARAGARLTALGEIVLDSTCRKALTNRLRVTDWCRHHPEVEQQAVETPLFILGFAPHRHHCAQPPTGRRSHQSIAARVGGQRIDPAARA